MFTVQEYQTNGGIIQYRRENLTDLRCRISTERIKRNINSAPAMTYSPDQCPFCPEQVMTATPTFKDGSRILRGESITFPNLYPFARDHTVTVITQAHSPSAFTHRQLKDAFEAQLDALKHLEGYLSINWNYLPSSGASISHPHLQGLVDDGPSALVERYLIGGHKYYLRNKTVYWEEFRDKEVGSERYLFGEEIPWIANPVPLGEREVRGILPICTPGEFEPYLDEFVQGFREVLRFYRRLGHQAFNASLFFGKSRYDSRFRAFCSCIARINPNPQSISDTAFMERIHLEPVILTLPEELAASYRNRE